MLVCMFVSTNCTPYIYIMIMTLSMCFELFVYLEHDYCEIVTTLIMYNIQILILL